MKRFAVTKGWGADKRGLVGEIRGCVKRVLVRGVKVELEFLGGRGVGKDLVHARLVDIPHGFWVNLVTNLRGNRQHRLDARGVRDAIELGSFDLDSWFLGDYCSGEWLRFVEGLYGALSCGGDMGKFRGGDGGWVTLVSVGGFGGVKVGGVDCDLVEV